MAPDELIVLGVLAVAGVVAGVVNSMAGGGGFLTLPLLMAIGLPAPVANGTTRVGVLLQNVSAVATFAREGHRPWALVLRLVGPMCAGALLGSWLATRLSADLFKPLVGLVFVVWAVLLIARPGSFGAPAEDPSAVVDPAPEKPLSPWSYGLAGIIGVYGGFLQAGVGFPLLAFLVGGLKLDPVRANAVKVALVLGYTCLALPVFAYAGQVAWLEAGVLAAGSMIGAYIGTRWQLKSGAGIVRWFVVVMVAVSGVVMIYRSVASFGIPMLGV